MPLISTNALTKRYGSSVTALDALTLDVEPGIIGLVGANGAGKSTLLKILLGLLQPTSGSATVMDMDVATRGPEIRQFVGYLPEHDCLPSDISATDFVSHMGRMSGLPAAAARERTAEVLRHVGLYEERYRPIGGYSTGMKQRVKLAQAIVHDPKLLLLDEPANGLDPAGIVAMRETLRYLASMGKTVFVSSHILGEVQQLADMIGIIANGRLVREGSLEQLLQDEGVVRIRVAAGEVERAAAALRQIAPDEAVSKGAGEDGWLAVKIEPNRAAEVNRTLAQAGVFASGLEAGSDLESLFLQLTGGEQSISREGTFFGAAGVTLPSGWGEPKDKGDGGGAS